MLDVKTHREKTSFNVPNLMSIDWLARFYGSDKNVFSVILIKDSIDETRLEAERYCLLPLRSSVGSTVPSVLLVRDRFKLPIQTTIG